MRDKLLSLESEALEELAALRGSAGSEEVLAVKTRYLGRKGPLASLMKDIAGLPEGERREAGRAANEAKERIDGEVRKLLEGLSKARQGEKLLTEKIDVTLPGRPAPTAVIGKPHPVTRITDEIEDIFISLGFEVAEGPEVETDYYNFEALNIPKDHPAREMQDTFYTGGDACLRTHTSPVQIRVMERRKPPLMVIAPGTVYRRDSDVTHTPMFHQIEGFMVDEGITFGDLKGVLTHFLHTLFGESTTVRFRPSFFPFTEPSAEVDIQCVICGGKGGGGEGGGGCRVCKDTGWLEILGCGMIHPEVFKAVDYDAEKYTGFAFGLGIERIAMLLTGIDDIRLFFENDLRFLKQF
ncbi:MAG: phenylalanine--tRNA ligase subunit alpha [Thermodesulfobacteriota bacterium]